MDIESILLSIGATVTLVASGASIFLEISRRRSDIKQVADQQKLQERQAKIEESRFTQVDLVRAAMENLDQYKELDGKVRDQFRGELQGIQERYTLLASDFDAYRDKSRLHKLIVSGVLDQMEVLLQDNKQNGDSKVITKEFMKLINQTRNEAEL